MEKHIVEKELSFRIMKAAFEVHNELGPGFLESLYDRAMAILLSGDGLRLERQKEVIVKFRGTIIGKHVLDNVVNQRVILEYKAVSQIAAIHKQQALSYLKATGLPLAIVINFGASRVEYCRVVSSASNKQSRTPQTLRDGWDLKK